MTDMLSGHSRLASVQAVQQVKASDSDLEAKRGKEETTSLVQDQPSEGSLSAGRQAAAKKHETKSVRRAKNDNITKMSLFVLNCSTHCNTNWNYDGPFRSVSLANLVTDLSYVNLNM